MFQSVKNKKESRCNSDHMKIQFYQNTGFFLNLW